jgi:lysophospholipase L1-like esterase
MALSLSFAGTARLAATAMTALSVIAVMLFSGAHWGQARAAGDAAHVCPAQEPCRILPLGDSITWGIGFDGGYRVPLFQHANEDGKHIRFVGPFANGPDFVAGQPFPKHHGGLSGWTIEQVTTSLNNPSATNAPHIVLVHVGTNDLYAHSAPTRMAERLERLLDRLQETSPGATVVVAQIAPLRDLALNDAAAAYNAELARRVAARRARGERLLLVDQFHHFPTSLLSADGVHPTQAGYERMAQTWYASIAPLLR